MAWDQFFWASIEVNKELPGQSLKLRHDVHDGHAGSERPESLTGSLKSDYKVQKQGMVSMKVM